MDHEFEIEIECDSEGYWVASVPALPGCHTQARSREEVSMRIQEAIAVVTAKSDSDNGHNQAIPAWHQEVLKERLNQLENHEEGLIDWNEAKKMLQTIADQCEAEPFNPHP